MANGGTRYRRGSIFGALTLITLGGLFLYANINPAFSVGRLFARYWPVLIILWGLSKMADYFLLRGTPDAAQAARLRGGEIFGLVMLVLFGMAFSQTYRGAEEFFHGDAGDDDFVRAWFHDRYEFPAELTEEIELPATLTVSGRGDISVEVTDGNQLRVIGQKTVYAGSRDEARETAELFQPVLEKISGGYELRWQQEGGADRTPEFDLELHVPASLSLNLTTRRGDISVTGLHSDLTVDLNRGELRVSKLQGNLTASIRRAMAKIEDVRGNVRIEGSGEEVRIRSVSGEAEVKGEYVGMIRFEDIQGPASFRSRRTEFRVPRIAGETVIEGSEIVIRGVPGELELETRNKDIEIDDVTGPIRLDNRNGPVVIRYRRPPTEPIEVTNRRGRIELLLPARSGFKIDARNEKGDIKSDFTGPDLTLDEEGRRTQTLVGRIGRGGTTIQLETTVGDIRLRRVE